MVVELRLLSTDEGGRNLAIFSGYRPNCWFGLWNELGTKTYNDVQLTFDTPAAIPPGGHAIVRAQPFQPQLVEDLVKVGMEFDVCEGPTVVAKAIVLEVLTD
jgi:hypothetical protein